MCIVTQPYYFCHRILALGMQKIFQFSEVRNISDLTLWGSLAVMGLGGKGFKSKQVAMAMPLGKTAGGLVLLAWYTNGMSFKSSNRPVVCKEHIGGSNPDVDSNPDVTSIGFWW